MDEFRKELETSRHAFHSSQNRVSKCSLTILAFIQLLISVLEVTNLSIELAFGEDVILNELVGCVILCVLCSPENPIPTSLVSLFRFVLFIAWSLTLAWLITVCLLLYGIFHNKRRFFFPHLIYSVRCARMFRLKREILIQMDI